MERFQFDLDLDCDFDRNRNRSEIEIEINRALPVKVPNQQDKVDTGQWSMLECLDKYSSAKEAEIFAKGLSGTGVIEDSHNELKIGHFSLQLKAVDCRVLVAQYP